MATSNHMEEEVMEVSRNINNKVILNKVMEDMEVSHSTNNRAMAGEEVMGEDTHSQRRAAVVWAWQVERRWVLEVVWLEAC